MTTTSITLEPGSSLQLGYREYAITSINGNQIGMAYSEHGIRKDSAVITARKGQRSMPINTLKKKLWDYVEGLPD